MYILLKIELYRFVPIGIENIYLINYKIKIIFIVKKYLYICMFLEIIVH